MQLPTFVAVVGYALLSPLSIEAQSSSTLQVGTHLQLRTASGRVAEGLLVAADPHALVLDRGGAAETIQIDSLVSLAARKRKSHFWAGAGIGLLSGAVIGGIAGSTQEFCFFDSCGPATGLGVMIGIPAGFLLGGIIGASITSERWEEMSIEQVRVIPAASARGVGVVVSVGF